MTLAKDKDMGDFVSKCEVCMCELEQEEIDGIEYEICPTCSVNNFDQFWEEE